MTSRKSLFTATLVLGSLLFSASAIAGPRGGSDPFMRGVRQLDLTEDQRAELQQIREEARSERDDTKSEMQSIREAFLAELAKDTPDIAALHALTDRKSKLRAANAHDKVERLVDVHAVLTPEQRAELLKNMEERSQKRGRRGGRRGGDGARGGDDDRGGERRRGGEGRRGADRQ